MTIDSGHWLEGVRRDVLPGGSAMQIRRCVVIHFTAGATGRSSVEFWKTPEAKGACAHIVIERDGTVIQCRQFNRTCGHAGVSRWRDPKTGVRYDNLNSCSIGIELANAGNDAGALTWAARQPGFESITARHHNGGAPQTWEKFPEEQVSACIEVTKALVERYNLDDITGHDCIAPERKDDPGPAFPMARLRIECGFRGMPAVHLRG